MCNRYLTQHRTNDSNGSATRTNCWKFANIYISIDSCTHFQVQQIICFITLHAALDGIILSFASPCSSFMSPRPAHRALLSSVVLVADPAAGSRSPTICLLSE